MDQRISRPNSDVGGLFQDVGAAASAKAQFALDLQLEQEIFQGPEWRSTGDG